MGILRHPAPIPPRAAPGAPHVPHSTSRASRAGHRAPSPLEPLESRTLMAVGFLDPSFDADGRLLATGGTGEAVAVQPDGKVITAGATDGAPADFLLRRFNVDGSPDLSFGTGGSVRTDHLGRSDVARAVVLQPDGRIVVAGSSNRELAVVRYLPNGAPDPSFSGDGIVTTSFGFTAAALDVALQPDGKIVAAGSAGALPGESTFALARYNADGSLDLSFGGDGTVTTDFGLTAAYAVAVGPDGRIVAGGTADTNLGDSALARYLPNGNLDPSFGPFPEVGEDLPPPGVVRSAFEGYGEFDDIQDVVVDADNTILAAGHLGGHGFVVARFSTDGLFADRFDEVQIPGTVPSLGAAATSLALAPGGQVVAAGYTASPTGEPENFAVLRFNPNGRLDQTFGFRGVAVTDFRTSAPGTDAPGPHDAATGVALAPGGAIVVAGTSDGRGALARFLGTGDPSPAPLGVTAANVLAVTGTPFADDVRIFPWADVIPRFGVDLNGSLFLSPLGVGRLSVDALGGNDAVRALNTSMTFPMELDGGAGNDYLTAAAGADNLRGGTGADILQGNRGNDSLDGGLGSDVVMGGGDDDLLLASEVGGPGASDHYSGGPGSDTVDYSGRTARMTIRLGLFATTGRERDTLRADVENAVGGSGADRIEGNDWNNTLDGGPGDDVLVGRAGNDVLRGGAGADVITDRVGTNTIDGGPGFDTINGVQDPGATVVLQAEDATLVGVGVSTANPGYTGAGYADYGNVAGQYVEWVFNNDAGPGMRTLTFRYANGSAANRPLDLRINGQLVQQLPFARTGNWFTWQTVTVSVQLVAGTNRIRLTSVGAGPNVDSLTIT